MMFKAAADICDVPWPTVVAAAAASNPTPTTEWPGIPPSPPKVLHERFFPPARGFISALQQPWEFHKRPPRHIWIRGIDGAGDIGLQQLPPIDPALASTLDWLLKNGKQTRTARGETVNANYYNLGHNIPFTDKATYTAAADARALFEVVSLALRDVNALSMLVAAVTLKIGNQGVGPAYSALDVNKAMGHCNLLCKHLTGWMGYMVDLMVQQERARWLAPHQRAEVKPQDKAPAEKPWYANLKAFPISPTDLFPGGGEVLMKVVAQRKRNEELTASLTGAREALQPPAPPTTFKQPDSRGRTEKKQHPQGRKPSASPAQNQGNQRQDRSTSRPPPPQRGEDARCRSQSRGRAPKQGK